MFAQVKGEKRGIFLPPPEPGPQGTITDRGIDIPVVSSLLGGRGLNPQVVEIFDIFLDIVTQALDDAGFQLPGPFFGDGIFAAEVVQGERSFRENPVP